MNQMDEIDDNGLRDRRIKLFSEGPLYENFKKELDDLEEGDAPTTLDPNPSL